MKILFVENCALDSEHSLSTCYLLKCKKIRSDNRFDFHDLAKNSLPAISNYTTVIFGCRSLFLYKCYRATEKERIKKQNLELFKIPNKYFIIQDMHQKTYGNITKLCKLLNDNKINVIFTFYNNNEARLIRKATPNVKHLHLPHHIDITIFTNLGLVKEYDIILFGSIHPTHYPFRKRLFELINKSKFKVLHVQWTETFDPTKCEYGLAKLINQSKIAISTKSKYDYLVGKYFEISACKTLIAGDMASDGYKIFNNKYLELNNSMTNDEIINKLEKCLSAFSEYKDKIDDLYNLATKEHNLDKYIEKMYNYVKL